MFERQLEPHADKDRTTQFGRWLTDKREAAGLMKGLLEPATVRSVQ